MKIGITERGVAGLNLDWFEKLAQKSFYGFNFKGAVLITKNANNRFQHKVFYLMQQVGFPNIVIHFTCTGWGNTPMEPNVPDYKTQLNNMETMIANGFPIENCVIRVDPIIPTPEGIQRADTVLQEIQKLQNKYQTKIHVRISIIDKYQHVCDRINPVYEYMWNSKTNFYPNQQERYAVLSLVRSYPEIQFETCAEPFLVRDAKKYGLSNIIESGCISETETKLFGLTNTATRNYPPQRKNCLCLNCKTELLENRNPFNATTCKPCAHQCKYCYWRD